MYAKCPCRRQHVTFYTDSYLQMITERLNREYAGWRINMTKPAHSSIILFSSSTRNPKCWCNGHNNQSRLVWDFSVSLSIHFRISMFLSGGRGMFKLQAWTFSHSSGRGSPNWIKLGSMNFPTLTTTVSIETGWPEAVWERFITTLWLCSFMCRHWELILSLKLIYMHPQ